jgi:cation-transporting ATPase E
MLAKKRNEFIEEVKNAPVIEADFMMGLSASQVNERNKEGFYNKVTKKVTKTYWEIFADNIFSFFNMVFFGIAILMLTAKMEPGFYMFMIPILCNIVVGLVSDIHARILVDKLRLVTDPKVRLMRDGKEVEVAVDDIVLSDIMVLTSGDQICADGLIVNGRLSLDESLVTGESETVKKELGEQVLSGTFVRSGKAYVRVNRVGIANYAEGLQNSAKRFERPNSELKSSCLKIFWTTGILASLFGIIMTITWLAKQDYSYESYQRFVASISGSMAAMIPAGLYLLTSLTLTIGVINLAKKRMNVQQLYCIEMLARVDTICFDKTGTLTDGNLNVKDLYNYSNMTDEDLKLYLYSLVNATGDENGTAKAIKLAYKCDPLVAEKHIPFDSEKKYSAAQFNDIGTIVLGAPGFVPSLPNEVASARVQQIASRGQRAIGIYFSKKPFAGSEIPAKLQWIGVMTLSDHIKEDAKTTIAWFKQNGVNTKVISGDNPVTVSEISNEVGVPGAANYISMENVKDEDIPSLVDKYTVFGRVKPEQKALIISALQEEGHKVAMTGDGVNDIIALKKADCSIAMASGSSAARNVAHMVSLDNDFSKLPDVVTEGRRVINNLQRTASLFLSKTIFAVILTFAFLIISWSGGHPYPFTTKNMIVWEMVTIGAGGLLLSLQPSKERLRGSFMVNVLSRSIPAGVIEMLSVALLFAIAAIWPSFLQL